MRSSSPTTWVACEASSCEHPRAAAPAEIRSDGSLARAFSRISLSSSGTPSRSGSPDMTRKATASGAPAPNGRRPVAGVGDQRTPGEHVALGSGCTGAVVLGTDPPRGAGDDSGPRNARAVGGPGDAEGAPTFSQAGCEEAESRTGHVDAGRVDKHAKPLVETVLLVENPSTRGFIRLSVQLPSHHARLEKAR